MTALSKTKSHSKPVVDFEFNLKSLKSYKWFRPKKYQSEKLKQSTKVYRLSQTKIK